MEKTLPREKPVDRKLVQERAPWFSLSKYEALRTASLETWCIQFALRLDLQHMKPIASELDSQSVLPSSLVHEQITDELRERGIIEESALSQFLQDAAVFGPAPFPILQRALSKGSAVRTMSIGDVRGVVEALEAKASVEEHLSGCENASPSHADSIYEHVFAAHPEPAQLLISIDIRLPREFLKRQLLELIDERQRRLSVVLPVPRESKKPSPGKWFKSKVLPYLDLAAWRASLPIAIQRTVLDSDIAFALDLDPGAIGRLQAGHAMNLTDEHSVEFLSLLEATISTRRRLTPLRRRSSPPHKRQN